MVNPLDKKCSVLISREAGKWYRSRFKSEHGGMCYAVEMLPVAFEKAVKELSVSAEADRIFKRLAKKVRRLDPLRAGEQMADILNDMSVTDHLLPGVPRATLAHIEQWLAIQPIFNRISIDIYYITNPNKDEG